MSRSVEAASCHLATAKRAKAGTGGEKGGEKRMVIEQG